MTEVLHSRHHTQLSESLILDDHTLYDRRSNKPIPVSLVHRHLMADSSRQLHWQPRLEDIDEAYTTRRLEHAGWIIDQLTKHEPVYYSSNQNRIALNKLAHPMQERLALAQRGETPPVELRKDIEAIYGSGVEQLKFLLEQHYTIGDASPGTQSHIEGSLSELTVFLLAARSLTGEDTDPHLIMPSTYAQDYAPILKDGTRQGYDFTVVRNDGTHIPLQVKTSTGHVDKYYADHILVVSIAELIDGTTTDPHGLAEAMYFEISNAQTYNRELIDTAAARLEVAFAAYPALTK